MDHAFHAVQAGSADVNKAAREEARVRLSIPTIAHRHALTVGRADALEGESGLHCSRHLPTRQTTPASRRLLHGRILLPQQKST
jgi:hypothetical protein